MDLLFNKSNATLRASDSCDFSSTDSTRIWRFPLSSTIKIVLSEFLLTSLFLSYGIYLAEFVNNGLTSFQTALWPPIIFITFWSISNPITTIIYNKNKLKILIPLTSGILLTSSIFLASFTFPWINLQILSYGIIGGISTSLILSQIRMEAITEFQSRKRLINTVTQVSEAVSLLIFPHLIVLLISWVGPFKAQIIHAAILLHTVPVILIKKFEHGSISASNPVLSRYKTIPGLINSQEMIDLVPPTRLTSTDIESNCSSSESLDSISSSDSDNSDVFDFKTEMGVHILPKIPEESETDEDDKQQNENNRLGGDKLSQPFVDGEKTDKFTLSIHEFNRFGTMTNIYLNSDSKDSIARSDKSCLNLLHLSPYQKYKCKKRKRQVIEFIQESVIKRVKYCLFMKEFYLVVFTKTLIIFGMIVFVTTLPLVLINNNTKGNGAFNLEDCPIILSAMSITWIFYLFFVPWLNDLSTIKKYPVFVIGLLVITISLLPASLNLSNDFVVIASLGFGLGYGIVNYNGEEIYSEYIGYVNWPECKEIVDCSSGILTLLIYAFLYTCNTKMFYFYLTLCCFYFLLFISWTYIFVKNLLIYS